MPSPDPRASLPASPSSFSLGGRWAAVLVLAAGLLACRAPEAATPKDEAKPGPPSAAAPAVAIPAQERVAEPTPAPEAEAGAEPAVAAAEPEPEPGAMKPLTPEQVTILFGTEEDTEPEIRLGITDKQANFHYTSGNERTLDAYYPLLSERTGGAYVGVGTDQAYFFMTWARFEIAWLIDYDPVIQQIHELYRLFFEASATPPELVALWEKDAEERAFAVIDAAHDEREAKQLRYWYEASRARIHRRLVRMTRRMDTAGVPSFLTDQEHYDYVRLMLEQRRVRPLLVDLLATDGLVALGEASKALGVPIRVLYLSNAEQYWKRYPKQFRANITALPFADDAVVLRTLLSQAINEDYRYNVQPAANYEEWLERPFVGNVYQIVRGGPKATPEGITLFETDADPDQSAAGQRYHARHEEG